MRGKIAFGVFVLACGALVGVACGGADETELSSDSGTSPTTTTPTSTSTTPTPTPTGTGTTPPTDASTPTDSGVDAAPTDGGPADAGSTLSFFVTSTGSGAMGGNLGGLAGADAKCQQLATAAGAGAKTWRAYLSITGTNARDRIGAGPWFNQKGKMIAANVTALHAADLPTADILDETGALIPAAQHDLLTGSNAQGMAQANASCNGWTSNQANQTAQVGHTDSSTTGNAADRWNSAHTVACTQQAMMNANGAGRIACFATN
jgi:hypothetical protein